MAKLKDASKGLVTAAKEIAALEKHFSKFEQFASVITTIENRILKQLTPMAQSMVLANYPQGGIHVITGDLKACIAKSFLVNTPKGFVIKMGRNFDKHVYIRASVFRKYKDWFKLSTSDIAKLQNEATRLLQAELNRYMAAGNKI